MDPIREAFDKIKEEMNFFKKEILDIKLQIKNIQTNPTYNNSHIYNKTDKQTNRQTVSTYNNAIEPLYDQNINSSIRNKGVPTDKQTNRQTDKQTLEDAFFSEFKQANKILNSLDSIKKEIRLKFKKLTPQEMLVFTKLYKMEDHNIDKITYKILAKELKLSESSIRDYINKLINKGVPIEKTRKNNKTIVLKISQDLKNIATLTTIQNLRKI